LLARDGNFDEATRQLEKLLAANPTETGIRADLLVVLQWAGRSADAIDTAAGLDPAKLADFELLAWARALRAERRNEEALSCCNRAWPNPAGPRTLTPCMRCSWRISAAAQKPRLI